MNILTDGLPMAVEIDGAEYQLNTDFRTCLKIILAFEDEELTGYEKQMVMLALLYKGIPPDTQKACELAVKFLNCGEVPSEGGEGAGDRLYSFTHDARYIYSAVDRLLCGRLNRGDSIHWWEFVTAFMELPEDCMMSRILYLRAQHAKGKLTKEERQQWAQMRDVLELPVHRTADEAAREEEFMRLLRG